MLVVTRLWQCLPDRAPQIECERFQTGLTKPLWILDSRSLLPTSSWTASREDDSFRLKAELSLLRDCLVTDSGAIEALFLPGI
jgi:hypothetical protein